MNFFSAKPKTATTVSEVFEKSVAEIREIKIAQELKAEQLRIEQSTRVDIRDSQIADIETKFNEESAINTKGVVAAESETALADKVINKFAEMFGLENSNS